MEYKEKRHKESEPHFYLRDKKSSGKTLIFLTYVGNSYLKDKLKYSIDESINPIDWDSKNERAKSTHVGFVSLNEKLDSVMRYFNNLRLDRSVSCAMLKYELDQVFRHNYIISKKEILSEKSKSASYADKYKLFGSEIRDYNTVLYILSSLEDDEKEFDLKLEYSFYVRANRDGKSFCIDITYGYLKTATYSVDLVDTYKNCLNYESFHIVQKISRYMDDFYQQMVQTMLAEVHKHSSITMHSIVNSDYLEGLKTKIVKLENKVSVLNKQIEESKVKKSPKPTYTYVFLDEHTGIYKIGKSNNPIVREKTILSQAPMIKMIYEIRDNVEKELHNIFADKRHRGEWFLLNDTDLNYIRSTYN